MNGMDSENHRRTHRVVARAAKVIIVAGGIVVIAEGEPPVYPGPSLPAPSLGESLSADGYRDDRTVTIPGSATTLMLNAGTLHGIDDAPLSFLTA